MDFVVFSDDWGGHPSSCQHLFRRLADEHRVIWVNSVGMRAPTFSIADLRKAARKAALMLGIAPATREAAAPTPRNLRVLQPPMVPLPGSPLARRFNDASALRSIRSLMEPLAFRSPTVVATVPNACGAVRQLGAARVVYYCVDDFAAWPGHDAVAVRAMEEQLIQASDLLVAAGETLADRLRSSGRPVRLLQHGVDVQHFAARSGVLPEVARMASPRVGFFGLIDERIDLELIAAVARARPDVQFVLAGPALVDLHVLRDRGNVHCLGALPYERLPELVTGLDVLWLPYRLNDFTRTLAPLKLRECLATGLPVVATGIPEVVSHRRWLHVADGDTEHVRAIAAALASAPRSRDDALAAYLTSYSWAARAEEFLRFLAEPRAMSAL